jgi:putative Holliday junction resolvase
MRTLAIDPGSRRIGLSLSDSSGRLATPYAVLQVSSPKEALAQIAKIIEKESVQRLVVGIPLNMDGSRGHASGVAAQFAHALATVTGQTPILIDERLSTFQAEQDLVDRKRTGEKITRRQKKSRLDALAATVFLQAYLDGKLPELKP